MESYPNEYCYLTAKNSTEEASQRRRSDWQRLKQRQQQELRQLQLGKEQERLEVTRLKNLKKIGKLLGKHKNLKKLKGIKLGEEGGGEKKDEGGGDKGGGGKGGGGGSEKKDKPDDSEKKDKEGGGRAGEKKDKTSGELRKMGANKVYGGWFTFGPGTCAEAVVDEPKQEEWLLTGFAFIVSVCHSIYIAAGVRTVTIHLCEWAQQVLSIPVVVWF